MRVAVSTAVYPERTLDKALRAAAEAGYAGVEIVCRDPHLPPTTMRQRVEQMAALVRELGLSVCCLGSGAGAYGDAMLQECRTHLDTLRVCMEFASILGCDLVAHGPGGPPERRAATSSWQQAADWMRRAADLARQNHMRVGMRMALGSLVETPEGAQRMLNMIARKEVGLILSPAESYLARLELSAQRLAPIQDRLLQVQVRDLAVAEISEEAGTFSVGDRLYEHRLLGEGEVDYPSIAEFLSGAGYGGWVTTEYSGPVARDVAAKHELSAIRRIFWTMGEEA